MANIHRTGGLVKGSVPVQELAFFLRVLLAGALAFVAVFFAAGALLVAVARFASGFLVVDTFLGVTLRFGFSTGFNSGYL